MKTVNINGVDCFVFLEGLARDKGMVINILTPVDASVPVADREYVNHRNWIGVGGSANEAAQLAARQSAKAQFDALTVEEIAQRVADAKKSIEPATPVATGR